MRKHLSVFELFVRSSLLPALLLSFVMAAVHFAVYFAFGAGAEMPLVNMMETMPFRYIFMAFAAALIFLQCKCCVGRRARPVYTLARLNVRPAMVFVWQSLCNVLLWLLFFAFEILTVLFICAHYVSVVGEDYATGQSLMLAYYRDDFLHSLLPMEDISRWLRNGVYILCMGIFCANSSRKLRLGKLAAILPTVAFAFAALSFDAGMGEGAMDVFSMIAMLLPAAIVVFSVFGSGEEIEDEQDEEAA